MKKMFEPLDIVEIIAIIFILILTFLTVCAVLGIDYIGLETFKEIFYLKNPK